MEIRQLPHPFSQYKMQEGTLKVWSPGRYYEHGSAKSVRKINPKELKKSPNGKYKLSHSVNSMKFEFHETEIYEAAFKDKPWPDRKNLVQ